MLLERGRGVDRRAAGEVVRAGAGDQPGGAERACDEGRVGQVADAQGEVEAFVQQRDDLVVQVQLHLYLRVFLEKGIHQRCQVALAELHRGGEAQQAANAAVLRLQALLDVGELGNHASAPGQVLGTLVGEGHAPGAAVEQAHTQVALQRGQRAHHRCHGLATGVGCRTQAAVVDDPHEIGHRLELVHCHLRFVRLLQGCCQVRGIAGMRRAADTVPDRRLPEFRT